ncbi:putative acyl-CoA dehydrogenase 6 [Styela clava]
MSRALRPIRDLSCLCRRLAKSHAIINSCSYKTWDESEESIYTEDHAQLMRSLRKIIDKDINPFVDAWEEKKEFPAHTVFKILGNAGFLGVNKPVAYGGLGLDYSYSVAVNEELGSILCGSIPMAIGVQVDMATPALAKFGSHELKEKFLAPSIRGDYVACLGVSETGSGSDVASIKTRAQTDGDDLIINGEKMWITNAAQADWMCMIATTNDKAVHSSKSLICVPMDLPGITIANRIDKIGMHSSDTSRVTFDDVRVPRSNIIGEEGAGFMYQMIQFQEERLFSGATALKLLQRAIDSTIDYARNRQIFGGSVLDHQSVHFRMAELQTEVEMLRSMVYRVVGLYIKGHDVTPLASMVKLKAGRLGREITDACLQYWGGMGFSSESIISRLYRDSRLISIGGGADEVMLSILCKYMGTLPKLKRKND